MLEDTDYDLLSECSGSRFSRSQRENIGCSRKQASHIDNIFVLHILSVLCISQQFQTP